MMKIIILFDYDFIIKFSKIKKLKKFLLLYYKDDDRRKVIKIIIFI